MFAVEQLAKLNVHRVSARYMADDELAKLFTIKKTEKGKQLHQ